MRKLIKFILSQLENIFNPTAKFRRVLNPDNPNEGFGDITEIFGGYGNFKGYVSENTKDAFLNRIANMMKPKEIPNGIIADAKVINAHQERMQIKSGTADMCRMIIQVNVTAQNGETWNTTLEDMVPQTETGAFQPGYTFSVKYDPSNKMNICRSNVAPVEPPDFSKY